MVVLAAEDPGSDDALALMSELGAVLARLTGASGAASFDAREVRGERAAFVVARAGDGSLLGCGALRPLDGDIAELKRMYARPGSGAGRLLLAHLEQRATALGYREMRLETRRVNTRALDFYRRHGYLPVPNFGRYVGRADAVCLGKTLSGGERGASHTEDHDFL